MLAKNKGDMEKTRNELQNYLINHVFEYWDLELFEFFMETSIVEAYTKELAEMITGNSHVDLLLDRAQELGNFLKFDGNSKKWKYRWQMREALLICLRKKYTKDEIDGLYHHAGLYYEMKDQVLEALEMYKKYDDVKSISRVLTMNIRKNPSNGRFFELRKYYLSLPEEIIYKNPVLIAGMSMLQSMLMNVEESERWYQALKKYSQKAVGGEKREAFNRLLYLDISLPHRGTVNLIEILKYAGHILRERKSCLPEFSVTSNLPSLMNGGKDFCEWSKSDRELAKSIGKIVECVLGKYGKGLVPLALAESFFEKGMDNYEVMSLAEKGKLSADSGGKVEQSFVAVGILTWLSVMNGNAEYAMEQLDIFRVRAEKEAENLLPNIDTFRCRICLYLGKAAEVERWMENAPSEMEEFSTMERFRYLTKVRIYIQYGKYSQACRLLEQVIYYAQFMKRTYILIEARLLLAIVLHRLQRKEWPDVLQQCITQAEEYHFVRLISREGPVVWKLLQNSKLVWKDQQFQRQVFEECKVMKEQYPKYLESGAAGQVRLSENALKILRMQAQGMSVKMIAQTLGIKEATVKYHSGVTYRKLGVCSKVEAVNEARRREMI